MSSVLLAVLTPRSYPKLESNLNVLPSLTSRPLRSRRCPRVLRWVSGKSVPMTPMRPVSVKKLDARLK